MAMTAEERRSRLGAAQVAALFDFIVVATVAAAAAAIVYAGGLSYFGYADPERAAAWATYIVVCGTANLILQTFYRRSSLAQQYWRRWAFVFTLLNFAVGAGFGWAPALSRARWAV